MARREVLVMTTHETVSAPLAESRGVTLGSPDYLLDAMMPIYDHTRVEYRLVDGPVPVVYRAARELDFLTVDSRLSDAAMFVRMIPARVATWMGRQAIEPTEEPDAMRMGDLFDSPDGGGPEWFGLAETPGRELVVGSIGRFWQTVIDWQPVDAATFLEFAEPGFGKIAMCLRVDPVGGGRSCITYEARTQLIDEGSRAKFARYWKLVSPFAGHIIRAALKTMDESVPR